MTDWDTFWRFEAFRRSCDPLDFRRWKKDSQRHLRELHPGDVRLLDATAGMGDHTVNLAEVGFRVEACDASPVAREYTSAAVREAGLDVPVHDVLWQDLAERFPRRFDLVFHDALHWVEDPGAMHACLRGIHGALSEGGSLVFFFADAREDSPGAGLKLLEWDWEHTDAERRAWDHSRQGARVIADVITRRHATTLEETHRFSVEPEGALGLRSAEVIMHRIYRWDWAAIVPAMKAAGFSEVSSAVFENSAKGYTFAMNHAVK